MDPKDRTLRDTHARNAYKESAMQKYVRLWNPNKENKLELPERPIEDKIIPFYPTKTTKRQSHDFRTSSLASIRQMKTEYGEKILKAVPDVEKDEDEEQSESSTGTVDEMHPDVPTYAPFKFKPGKPDRVKKVLRFFAEEEEKVLRSAQKQFAESKQEKKVEEEEPKGKIYFGSIKNRVPKMHKTQAQISRKKKMANMNASQTTDEVINTKRRGSGNLAAAIGLYKSG